MSVDTYLQGKNTSHYREIHNEGGIQVLVSPNLVGYAHRVDLVIKKKLIGSKLIAIAHHEHSARCRH